MIEEAKSLLENGITKDKLIYYGLEYKYLAEYHDGQYNYNDMFQKLNSAIHRFSKRQMTWFRKMERDGFKINWIDGKLPFEDKVEFVLNKIKAG
jgi:tRNA dimethylallyltransferase